MHTFLIFNKYFLPVNDPVHSVSERKDPGARNATEALHQRNSQQEVFTSSSPTAVFVNLDERTDHQEILQVARDIYLRSLPLIS